MLASFVYIFVLSCLKTAILRVGKCADVLLYFTYNKRVVLDFVCVCLAQRDNLSKEYE
jgi:hypothetical protein